jgi:hypothetical protein
MTILGEVGLRLKPGLSIGQLFFHRVEQSDPGGEAKKAMARHSTFSGASRPILGEYHQTAVEEMLVGKLN